MFERTAPSLTLVVAALIACNNTAAPSTALAQLPDDEAWAGPAIEAYAPFAESLVVDRDYDFFEVLTNCTEETVRVGVAFALDQYLVEGPFSLPPIATAGQRLPDDTLSGTYSGYGLQNGLTFFDAPPPPPVEWRTGTGPLSYAQFTQDMLDAVQQVLGTTPTQNTTYACPNNALGVAALANLFAAHYDDVPRQWLQRGLLAPGSDCEIRFVEKFGALCAWTPSRVTVVASGDASVVQSTLMGAVSSDFEVQLYDQDNVGNEVFTVQYPPAGPSSVPGDQVYWVGADCEDIVTPTTDAISCEPTVAMTWVPGDLFRFRDMNGDSYFPGPRGGSVTLQDDGSLETTWLANKSEWEVGVDIDTYFPLNNWSNAFLPVTDARLCTPPE